IWGLVGSRHSSGYDSSFKGRISRPPSRRGAMTVNGWLQIALFCAVIIALTRPFGGYMTRVFNGERTLLSPVLRPVERGIYALCGVRESEEQNWLGYAFAMLVFSLAGFLILYALQRLQAMLPFNPAGQSNIEASSALNTSISFVTNTNWQSYVPETTMSYLTQMAGLTVHNFVSAAAGIAMAIALIRGFARRSAKTIGNFWVDLTRCVLYILLPISIVVALIFVWQGMPQNLGAYTEATTLEGAKQVIAQGPVASQEVIKMMGTNGGGFFNANSAHPFENPTPLTNFIQIGLIFCIGAGLTNVLGRMVGNQRQGWAIFAAMGVLFLVGVTTVYWAEGAGNPAFAQFNVDQTPGAMQAGGNMEGKEVRCGVGSGLYGMLAFAIVAMFVAGLMVGRTPEYLGKKLEAKEVKMAIIAILFLPFSILLGTAISTVNPNGLAGIANTGPHGFSEILYAFTSATGNNGSAFAGISANTLFYNTMLSIAMFIGRFVFVIPLLAVAGSLAAKKVVAPSAGTFPTHGPLFVGLLVGVIVIIGGLTYFPAIALGPVVEQVAMNHGTLFAGP